MKKTLRLVCIALFAVVATGCAMVTPNYQPSVENVEALKKAGVAAANVGTFDVSKAKSGATSIAIRANTMSSSVGANYGSYLANALKQELELAKSYDSKATNVISGSILKNDIAAGGMSTNSGEMEVQFVVKRGDAIRFDKVVSTTNSWESSFVGAIAIPKAQQQYPLLVQKLIAKLFGDKDFINALKP